MSSLQIKHKAPSVSFSRGTEPLRPELPMSLACECRHVTSSGYSLTNDQNSHGPDRFCDYLSAPRDRLLSLQSKYLIFNHFLGS